MSNVPAVFNCAGVRLALAKKWLKQARGTAAQEREQ